MIAFSRRIIPRDFLNSFTFLILRKSLRLFVACTITFQFSRNRSDLVVPSPIKFFLYICPSLISVQSGIIYSGILAPRVQTILATECLYIFLYLLRMVLPTSHRCFLRDCNSSYFFFYVFIVKRKTRGFLRGLSYNNLKRTITTVPSITPTGKHSYLM